ncbi:hypothetical protein SADUNF_Sadunf13G0101300 [Salix dunnii]|uniref:Hydrophobic seed protein domain-containing protein n=1 Tax=Salix dunnii TaxID=1413687 RepID=A0A835JJU4_9ROSI|nr:hypothetical protein SADUNF_Sadunf13G0101300 [Salix dunnii]
MENVTDIEHLNIFLMVLCNLIDGLVDLEAAVCLCTRVRADLLGLIKLDIPVAVEINATGRLLRNSRSFFSLGGGGGGLLAAAFAFQPPKFTPIRAPAKPNAIVLHHEGRSPISIYKNNAYIWLNVLTSSCLLCLDTMKVTR